MHDGTETGFTLDDDIWNTHLPAKSGKEYDELDGVDIVCNDDKRRLLCFHEGHNVVKAVLHKQRFLVLFL